MQHVLRAISGPHAGAVYVLGGRTTIGRASDCDIQILHEGVSRHHAKITLEDDGTIVVIDLLSDNGTFVEDERVERHVLVAGEVVRVMRSRFTYEVLDTDDVRTSVAFHRKVTSGDSLRQTVHHDKSSVSVRSGLAQGLPGGVMGERDRSYSRPQAAAPALSGARPGAAAGRPGGVETPAPEQPSELGEIPRVRRPTPPHGVDTGASVRDRRPRVASATVSAHEASPMGTRPAEPVQPVAHAPAADPSSRGGYVGLGQGRRERVTVMPGSGAPPSSTSAVRVERAMAPSSEPAGRMAAAPSGAEHQPQRYGSSHGTGPMGSGWVRVTRPLESPGSMRPGATLTGRPGMTADTSVSTASPSGHEADGGDGSVRSTTHETAEYGIAGERQTTERGLAVPTALPEPAVTRTPASPLASTRSPTVLPSSPPPASEDDAELDAMATVPALRRVSARSSSTPTEEMPSIRDVEPLDEDSRVKTQPRVTLMPRDRGPAAPPRTGLEVEAASSSAVEVLPSPAAPPERPADPSSPPSAPEAAHPIDAALARRLTSTGGARSRSRAIGYEDTLRFQRPEPSSASQRSPPRSDALQSRPHATTAEVISALESLLPPDDATSPLPTEPPRPDARTHVSDRDASTPVGELLDVALADVVWPVEVAHLSQLDKFELRAQQVLEDADREHKRRVGIERLVDILEYRELRLRALQSSGGNAGAAERCVALEEALQQRAPAGDDMAAMRRYHRFACSIPAQLTHLPRGAKSTATVEIEDLSAGGARITFGEYTIGAGETVWLAIDLSQADRSRIPDPTASTVVMKARVVWSRPHEAKLGLIFAGAPQYGP